MPDPNPTAQRRLDSLEEQIGAQRIIVAYFQRELRDAAAVEKLLLQRRLQREAGRLSELLLQERAEKTAYADVYGLTVTRAPTTTSSVATPTATYHPLTTATAVAKPLSLSPTVHISAPVATAAPAPAVTPMISPVGSGPAPAPVTPTITSAVESGFVQESLSAEPGSLYPFVPSAESYTQTPTTAPAASSAAGASLPVPAGSAEALVRYAEEQTDKKWYQRKKYQAAMAVGGVVFVLGVGYWFVRRKKS